MAIKIYTKEYAKTVESVFASRQHFLRTFGGKIQVKQGAEADKDFLTLKVSDTDSVIQEYSTDENVGFGTGTGKTSRFGNRKEIKSIDKTIPWEAPLAIHEGVDKFTVNDIPDQVVAERQAKQAEAWTEKFNHVMSKAISDSASKTLTGTLNAEGVKKVFNEAVKEMTNNKVRQDIGKVAYVNADVYNLLVDNDLTTTAKGSTVNIDRNEVKLFKGFIIELLADDYFQTGENIYFAADNVGVLGTGIEVYRVIDSEDFNGVAVQSAAKYAKYIPEVNHKAILKAILTGSGV